MVELLPNGTYFRVINISQHYLNARYWSNIKVNDIIISINGRTFENWRNIDMTAFIQNQILIDDVIFTTNNQIRVTREMSNFKSLKLSWDRECEFCGYVGLGDASTGEIAKCCSGGKFKSNGIGDIFSLNPLSDKLHNLLVNNVGHMTKYSNSYNYLFALSITGIDNGRQGGFEHRVGDHCVTICGNMHHMLPFAIDSPNISNGISYFMFDHTAEKSIEYISKYIIPNRLSAAATDSARILIEEILDAFKTTLNRNNKYVQDLKAIGLALQTADQGDLVTPMSSFTLTTQLTNRVQYLEVGHIKLSSATNERNIQIIDKNNKSTKIEIMSEKLEPLSYPIFFLYGETGWGDLYKDKVKFFNYVANRMLMPEIVLRTGRYMTALNKYGESIRVNR
jgi:hypothetical protein